MDAKQFPKKLVICGVPHKIRYVDQPTTEGGEITCGEFYEREQAIEIALGAHTDEQHVWRTLLHESIHAILHMSGHAHNLDNDQEEAIVTALEYGLMGLWPQLQQKQA